jgi:hypothetical protein
VLPLPPGFSMRASPQRGHRKKTTQKNKKKKEINPTAVELGDPSGAETKKALDPRNYG